MKTIAIHSFKGGTGKSLIATNLAVLYALRGEPTCLVDMDFRAPTLHVAFNPRGVDRWFNDYLDGECEPEEVLVDVAPQLGLKARLAVAFANPSPEAIREMMAKPTSWERKALDRLLDFTRRMRELKFSYCILDTSPGYLYSSINALVAADVAVIVSTVDDSDIEGTRQMIKELYELLERRTFIVVNKAVGAVDEGSSMRVAELVGSRIGRGVACVIPCSCDIAERPRRSIFALEKADHVFIKRLEGLSHMLAEG
ncbi:hypothetical protein B6U99_06080 [Candidatus Geothermarchaeota archaeon ex4572_27]|nr:MAG: hypothetical protein B6U99_06080 [Candidatus Geothermarchaeota archaeon ex4572_27]